MDGITKIKYDILSKALKYRNDYIISDPIYAFYMALDNNLSNTFVNIRNSMPRDILK